MVFFFIVAKIGMGIITLDRMYPLCLGSNVGTTSTALLAAMAADQKHLQPSLQAALCHMFFNIGGILIFYVPPFLRVPIKLAQALGDTTAK
jgi:sodium-dependent phosphate cotransporter